MSSARGNRGRRAEGTAREQSTIDRLTNIMARLLEREVRRDEHGKAMNNAGSEFRRLNPPTFEGGVDPITADQWLRTMERMIEVAKVPEEEKVTCVSFMLRGTTEYWWDSIKRIHDEATIQWVEFKEHFYNNYFSETVRSTKRREFVYLQQGRMSVLEYIQKFDELSQYAPHMVATEDLKKDHFMQGLHKDLAKDLKVAGVRDASFNDLIDQALVIEQVDEEKKEGKRKNKGSVDQGNFVRQHTNNNKRKGTLVVQDQSKSKCQKNHQKEVPQKPKCNQCGKTHPGECRANTRTCFKCGKEGHFIRDCLENGTQQEKANARVFTLTKTDAEGNPSVISCELSISKTPAYVLIDSGATHSFASPPSLRK
ncbi:uncharacterized protein LOC112099526 [Citrus clementina]|uniref:uncharacterized protein LOC112099526 n=1 Tax=Citrus clementina TaxID=85681 RepID=UPI000CED7376|nr:uncharacterized protein LOC112099526 [Citrus x clementina]